MPSRLLYLAHTFDLRYEMRNWQKGFERRNPEIEFLNPFFYKGTCEKFKHGDRNGREYYQHIASIGTKLVEQDIRFIAQSDGVVSVLKEWSAGTLMEMVWGFVMHKPVYSVIMNGQEEHPFIKYHSKKVFTNLRDFERFVKSGRLETETVKGQEGMCD